MNHFTFKHNLFFCYKKNPNETICKTDINKQIKWSIRIDLIKFNITQAKDN